MKKFIAACTLALASGAVFAGSGPFGNPDLGGSQYPATMTDPAPSRAPVTVSIDDVQRGSPDGYDGFIERYAPVVSDGGPAITSYDEFIRGNPDLDHSVGS